MEIWLLFIPEKLVCYIHVRVKFHWLFNMCLIFINHCLYFVSTYISCIGLEPKVTLDDDNDSDDNDNDENDDAAADDNEE